MSLLPMKSKFDEYVKMGLFRDVSKQHFRSNQYGKYPYEKTDIELARYAPKFWQIDTTYMSDREQIAELMGRIHECNEPSLVRDYRDEIDTIQRRINDQSS